MWALYFLASVGTVTILSLAYFFLVPLADWVLRMVGYGIFIIKISPLKKSKSWKHLLKFLFVGVPKECLKESRILGGVWAKEVSAKGVTWKPYFTYLNKSKIDK
jgi:hypothetical protein